MPFVTFKRKRERKYIYVRFKRNKSPMMADDEARRNSQRTESANDFFDFFFPFFFSLLSRRLYVCMC